MVKTIMDVVDAVLVVASSLIEFLDRHITRIEMFMVTFTVFWMLHREAVKAVVSSCAFSRVTKSGPCAFDRGL